MLDSWKLRGQSSLQCLLMLPAGLFQPGNEDGYMFLKVSDLFLQCANARFLEGCVRIQAVGALRFLL